MEHLWLTGLDIYDLMEGDLYHLMGGALLYGWGTWLQLSFLLYYEYTVAKQNYEYTAAKQNGGGAEWVELL